MPVSVTIKFTEDMHDVSAYNEIFGHSICKDESGNDVKALSVTKGKSIYFVADVDQDDPIIGQISVEGLDSNNVYYARPFDLHSFNNQFSFPKPEMQILEKILHDPHFQYFAKEVIAAGSKT